MTISIWRYSHLTLAVSCFLFLTLASLTGLVLAVDAVQQSTSPGTTQNLAHVTLAQSIAVLTKDYAEVSELSVDNGRRVTLKGIDNDGKDVNAYIDPRTGKVTGKPRRQSSFIQWTTSLHRSLFLHETGRFFVGLTSFLLLLIAVSGIVLVIQRQQGLRRFFARIVKDYFAQYYHVLLGRLMLIPIVVIALTGTYLSMVRFHLFPEKKIERRLSANVATENQEPGDPTTFAIFKETNLSQVRSVEFPFSEDPEEHFTVKLKDRELTVDQFDGKVLSEVRYPFTEIMADLSLNLHTGRPSAIWAAILGIASLNILFFIYSGFAITFKRRDSRIKNKFKADEVNYILLVGSENGSTLRFANAIYQQLLANGKKPFLAELNQYRTFPQAEHILVFTSTYGLGEAPANARKFAELLPSFPQEHSVNVSVVAFGSHSYPDFCAYGLQVDQWLHGQDWARPLLPVYTVADKSTEEFSHWVKDWAEKTGIPLVASAALYSNKPKGLQNLILVEKEEASAEADIFKLRLRLLSNGHFTSGDLLAVYPAGDQRERFYSIGKTGRELQLVIRHYPNGFGSNYLRQLMPGDMIKANILENKVFHFPRHAPAVIMIANGTGIAPFLGMLTQNKRGTPCYFYGGFRTRQGLASLAGNLLKNWQVKGHLTQYTLAYSRESEKQYVTAILEKDTDLIVQLLEDSAVLMICGSISMGHNVLDLLEKICFEKSGHSISYYKEKGQVKMDCY